MFAKLSDLFLDVFKIILAVVLLENAFNVEGEGSVDIIWGWIAAFACAIIGVVFGLINKKSKE